MTKQISPLELWYRIVEYLKSISQDEKIKYGSYDNKDGDYIAVFEGYPISIIENALKDYVMLCKITNIQPHEIFIRMDKKIHDENVKQLKAFEIIKEKNVIISALKLSKTLIGYHQLLGLTKTDEQMRKYMLTQEEFDLLKEFF